VDPKILYAIIFKRKSIRNYDPEPLDETTLAEITRHISELIALYPEIKTEIQVVSPECVRGFIRVNAPHYLVAFSEVRDGYRENIGFLLQQMDLFFSASGIGSCWQAWLKPTRDFRKNKDLEFVIVMAFGRPKETLHRGSLVEFKRKKPDRITSNPELHALLEPARLAPCGGSEPWYFTGDTSLIHAYCIRPVFLTGKHVERMNHINMGIALCHLWIAALSSGKKVERTDNPAARENPPDRYYYSTSLAFQQIPAA